MRPTRQRAAVARALGGSEAFRSAQEVHEALRASGDGVGLTTVYRTLQAMAAAGEVDVLRHGDEAVYRRCRSGEHHHHLVCRSCGTTVELAADEVEAWAAAVAQRHGFGEVSHTVEVFGVCRDCQPKTSG
ncbi:MAG TPA: Fur family transcriptional regulator [Mycobacteriales bacterium]|nr:Fur family transcriptional regulator [Mycobacteriales bacterium]